MRHSQAVLSYLTRSFILPWLNFETIISYLKVAANHQIIWRHSQFAFSSNCHSIQFKVLALQFPLLSTFLFGRTPNDIFLQHNSANNGDIYSETDQTNNGVGGARASRLVDSSSRVPNTSSWAHGNLITYSLLSRALLSLAVSLQWLWFSLPRCRKGRHFTGCLVGVLGSAYSVNALE